MENDPIMRRITQQKLQHRAYGRWRNESEWSRHGMTEKFGTFRNEIFERLGSQPPDPSKYESPETFKANMKVNRISSRTLSSIPRLDGIRWSNQEFHELIETESIPCIISGLAKDWKMSAWTIDSLSNENNFFAKVKFKVDEQPRTDTEKENASAHSAAAATVNKNDLESDIDALQSSSFKLPLHEFMHYLQHNHDDVPLYIFDSVFDCDSIGRKILDEFTVPPFFSHDLFSYLGEVRRPPYRWLLIGPERSGSSAHIDPLATSAWNTLIDGIKLWILFPAHIDRTDVKGKHLVSPTFLPQSNSEQQKHDLTEDDVADAMEAVHYFTHAIPQLKAKHSSSSSSSPSSSLPYGMIEFLQFPGETVFIPHGWLHTVLNLTPTIAITQNYVSPRNFTDVWIETRKYRPHMAQRWREQLEIHEPILAAKAETFNMQPPLSSIPPLVLTKDRLPVKDYVAAAADLNSWYFHPSSDEDSDDDTGDDGYGVGPSSGVSVVRSGVVHPTTSTNGMSGIGMNVSSSSSQLVDSNDSPEEETDPKDRHCCGLRRSARTHEWRIYHPVHLALGLLVLLGCILAGIFLFVDVGLRKVSVSTVTSNGHFSSSIVAGIFAGFACLLSAHQIYQHRQNWTHASSQKYTERVLLMVPIYAVSAFLGLVFLSSSSYFDFLRTCYEAYTIYCFLLLLSKYVGGHAGVVEAMKSHSPESHWPTPLGMCCRAPVTVSSDLIWRLKRGTLQYSIIAPLCALVAVAATKAGHYEEGIFAWENFYVYTTIVINCSQMIALYCLVWIYHGICDSIEEWHPLAKFLAVKAVVFLSFWQGVIIAALVHFKVIHDGVTFDAAEIQVGLQDLIICIEMFIAACAHHWIFPVTPYQDGSAQRLIHQASPQSVKNSHKTNAKNNHHDLLSNAVSADDLSNVLVTVPSEHAVNGAPGASSASSSHLRMHGLRTQLLEKQESSGQMEV